ncbi:MAG: SLC13 family permease [Acidimicrobiales bacterium]
MLSLGAPAAVAAAAFDAHATALAARQDWPPFVLVSGLLLIGLVARGDGLFEVAGAVVARAARFPALLLLAVAALVAVVTVTLNLDTSVTFVTPVVLSAARRSGRRLEPFAYLVLWMSNAGSLLLPGSNLTNLIVLAASRTNGAQFVARLAAPWGAAAVCVVLLVAAFWRSSVFGPPGARTLADGRARLGPGVLGVAVAIVAMLISAPQVSAIIVAGTGLVLVAYQRASRHVGAGEIGERLNVPLLVGLFGAACALGTLGRDWSGPHQALGHLGLFATAGIGAGTSILVNNLPAASLLAARHVAHPGALLVGLNLGPNLVVSGSLAGLLWLQASRASGFSASIRRTSALGLAVVPATMACALAALLAASN